MRVQVPFSRGQNGIHFVVQNTILKILNLNFYKELHLIKVLVQAFDHSFHPHIDLTVHQVEQIAGDLNFPTINSN